MDEKRYGLLKKRADNCLEKLDAFINGGHGDSIIHDSANHKLILSSGIRNLIFYKEKYGSYYYNEGVNLDWLENYILKVEKYLLRIAKQL